MPDDSQSARAERGAPRRPRLLYDGDCGFCAQWVGYWQALTGARVEYAPYQAVAAQHPELAPDALARAVHLVEPDGRVSRAAEASLRTLAYAPGHGLGLWFYRHVPGVAWIAERSYAGIAARRPLAARVTRLLWGRQPLPSRYERTSRLLLASLALMACIAFVSLGVQIDGLAGPDGVLPLADHLAAVARRYPAPQRWWLFPTLFWCNASAAALQAACALGAALSLLAVRRPGTRLALAALYVLYLSLFYAGQVFTAFQWDLLLLELLFIATLLCHRPGLLVLALRLLLWRFLLMSGLVKLHGDPAWASLAALRHHFETQPLPSPLAWPAAQAGEALLKAGAAGTLAIELLLPFLFFAPRRLRLAAAALVALFQAGILATGNYGFFNLLVLVMCLALLDDQVLPRPRRPVRAAPEEAPEEARGAGAARLCVAVTAALGLLQIGQTLHERRRTAAEPALLAAIEPLHIVNRYGPFASLTVERPALIVEGSRDGVHWVAYAWRYQPMDEHSVPRWNVPHQPRLDWQLWFAAAETTREQAWFAGLLAALLRGSPAVRGLLGADPFGAQPPAQLRARLVQLRFADRAVPGRGAWWQARPGGLYVPPVQLGPDGQLQRADLERIVTPS